MIKKNLFKYSSVLMCVVLMTANLVGCGNTAGSADIKRESAVSEQAAGSTESLITSVIGDELAMSKTSTLKTNARKETVYVFSDASGKQDRILVNEKVTDASGRETNSQSKSDRLAPVTVDVTYQLDGAEVNPEDMAGKSGKVTMRFSYTNHEKKEITVNGKKQTAYVPFTMVTGMMLPQDKFSNIEVTNGKVTKVGDNVVALGITMPGLKDSLNLKFDDEELSLDIPEYFEVTADVTDFELDMTMSVATTSILGEADVENLTIEDLKEKMNTLQSAANQLTDGTEKLQSGTQTLEDSIPELVSGVGQLDDGASALVEGSKALSQGGSSLDENMSAYASSMDQLYRTLKENGLDNNMIKLLEGAESVNAGIVKLDAGAADLSTGAAALKDGAAALNEGINGDSGLIQTMQQGMALQERAYNEAYAQAYEMVADANAINYVKANSGTFKGASFNDLPQAAKQQVMSGVKQTLEANGIPETPNIASTLLSETDNQAVKITAALCQVYSGYAIALPEGELKESTLTSIIGLIAKINQYNAAYKTLYTSGDSIAQSGLADGVKELADGSAQLADGAAQLASGTAQLKAGSAQLAGGLSQMQSSVGTFDHFKEGTLCSSIYQLNIAAARLRADGTSVLAKNLDTLSQSLEALKAGTSKLNSASGELSDGVRELNAGAVTLRDGMAEFNETGIKSITSLVGDDADAAIDTIKEVVKLGKDYDSFLGRSDDKTNSVTFIYKTAEISK